MDFISNLIKRPISLVLNETSTTMDKYPISASLPNTPIQLENKKGLTTSTNEDQKLTNPNHKNNNRRAISMSSSYNEDIVTDFIGVPEEFLLDEFKDILPPPPFSLQNSNPLNQSLLDIDITRSLSITPPPPLSPSTNASQTIDELLSQINDNLHQAGLNDDVLAIASPPSNLELGFVSNTQLNSSKISIVSAGSANLTVENNSSVHKLHIDPPQSESGLILDGHKQQQQELQQHGGKDQFNNSGANKTSNKFVGLTEFDETKIPELPGDLNPNIEEQYNVTFEECFIPTLNAQQSTTVPDEFKVDKTHLLLSNETDVTSSDNEIFADCDDEKDPLAATFAEPFSSDITDLESFQSAGNKSFNSTLNNTMENIADISTETIGCLADNINKKEIEEELQCENMQTHIQRIDEDEPMDIDMNATMEVIQNTSNNIQHVEKVLQHAENILQNLEEKNKFEGVNTENRTILMKNQANSSNENMAAAAPLVGDVNKTDHVEKEQSRYELSLNKSIELLVNESKSPSTECIIENLTKDMVQEDNEVLKKLKTESDNNLNSKNDTLNSNTISNSLDKSMVDSKTETKMSSTAVGFDNSLKSQKMSAPTSPSFPSKTTQSPGFPRSPKAVSEKQRNFPFMEKSDYLINNKTQAIEDKLPNNSNGSFNESSPNTMATNSKFNASFQPMDIDEHVPENSLTELPRNETEILQCSPLQNSQSSHLPNMQQKSQSSLPVIEQKLLPSSQPSIEQSSDSPSPITLEQDNIKEEQISPESLESTTSSSFVSQPLSTLIQKRPPIRDARIRSADILSEKEQSNIKAKDEKDVFVERDTPSPVSATVTSLTNCSGFSEFDQTASSCSSMNNNEEHQKKSQQIEDEFRGSNIILNPSDFDYLLTKGNNNIPVDRSSLLLKFDPLLGVPVPVNQGQQQLQLPTNTNIPYLTPTIEEDEHNDSNPSFVIDTKSEASAKLFKEGSQEIKQQLQLEQQVQQNKRPLIQGAKKKNATMSVDVMKDMSLDNDCNKTFENSNSTQSDDKQINYKMDELEKKIKNEVLKTEDIEKKLKDGEQREEALIKRITEKDKTIAKMAGVVEAYEKTIAELIADKEQITQHYEKQLAEVKADRDSNYHHLTSLETTFSDLHVKYGKSKEMTCQLKENEEALKAEKRKNIEYLHLQEQRYDKMKNHAMQQLEIANKKLESLTREHSIEITKLKALLKKEEIARSSINEQLAHKTKENAELVKICDELISGQGSNFSLEPFDSKKH